MRCRHDARAVSVSNRGCNPQAEADLKERFEKLAVDLRVANERLEQVRVCVCAGLTRALPRCVRHVCHCGEADWHVIEPLLARVRARCAIMADAPLLWFWQYQVRPFQPTRVQYGCVRLN